MASPHSSQSTAADAPGERELAGMNPDGEATRERLQTLQGELERSRQQLTEQQSQLDEARQAAEAAAEARDRFISNVSHELRTPLSAILLWTSLIDEQQVNDPQLAEALQAIKRSAEEQSALIDDIVDTSRLLAGKLRLELETVDVSAVLREAVAATAVAAREKQIQVIDRFDPLPWTRVDARRLRQLAAYLLNNAIKFTPAGGQAIIRLRQAGPLGFAVSVSDTGAGIAPAILPELLERRPQLGGKCARSEIGLGLGLVLARRLAELHGGHLVAESAGPGLGATFTVELPLTSDAAAEKLAPEAPAPTSTRLTGAHTVLLVDPLGRAPGTLATLLQDAGAQVTLARSGDEGWTAFKQSKPDAVVATVGGPDDGSGLVQRIRRDEEASGGPSTPALALAASADPALLERALEAGFQTCLTLPVDPRHLVSMLDTLLRQRPPSGG